VLRSTRLIFSLFARDSLIGTLRPKHHYEKTLPIVLCRHAFWRPSGCQQP
jgi:hypothetical protein